MAACRLLNRLEFNLDRYQTTNPNGNQRLIIITEDERLNAGNDPNHHLNPI